MTDTQVRIITNNVPRFTVDAYELDEKERKEFDYIDWPAIERGEESATFFRYKGDLYDLGEFLVWESTPNPFPEWSAYRSDSFFSGLIIRWADPQFESIIVGRYMS